MTTKKAKPTQVAITEESQGLGSTKPRTAIQITLDPSKTEHQQLAEISVSPVLRGMSAAKSWMERQTGEIGINEAIEVAQKYADAASNGDLAFAKSMLVAQAITLDAIFNDMARRAGGLVKIKDDGSWSYTGDTMDAITRVAFKAQSQCRTTLQTLGELVNPRTVVIAKQANMTNGPQQVNNGTPAPRAQESEIRTNELLEDNPSERLERGAQSAASRVDPWMATVGALNRSKDREGKVHQLPQRGKARAAQ
jgi:hypothetical protein